MQQSEAKRTISYVPDSGAAVRYALAVPLLMVMWDRRAWLVFVGLLAGAVWWAFVGIQRQQVDWWLGFVAAAVVVIGLFVAFAVAVYRRDSELFADYRARDVGATA